MSTVDNSTCQHHISDFFMFRVWFDFSRCLLVQICQDLLNSTLMAVDKVIRMARITKVCCRLCILCTGWIIVLENTKLWVFCTLVYIHVRWLKHHWCKLFKNDIDQVVIAGGSSRMPVVGEMLQAHFPGKRVGSFIQPELAIVQGAAIRVYLKWR